MASEKQSKANMFICASTVNLWHIGLSLSNLNTKGVNPKSIIKSQWQYAVAINGTNICPPLKQSEVLSSLLPSAVALSRTQKEGDISSHTRCKKNNNKKTTLRRDLAF